MSHNTTPAPQDAPTPAAATHKVSRRSQRMMHSSLTLGFLMAAGGAVLWGLNGTLSKYLMSHYGVTPLWFSCVRQLTAGLMFLACAAIRTPRSLKGVVTSPREMGRMLFLSIFCVLLVQLGYLEAIDWTNSATATVLQSVNILFVLVYVCVRAHKAPRRRDAIGAVLALLGVFLLATGGNPAKLALPWQGLAWGLGEAAATAMMAILPLGAIAKWGNFTVNAITFLMSGIVLLCLAPPWRGVPALDATGWLLLALSVAFGTFAAFGVYLKGVSVIGSVRGSMVGTLEPLTAAVTSAVCLGTSFTGVDLMGFAAIIAMVFLTA
ncbi:MAG: DMT family transporter [Bifidobacteriaceae bacterium]|nr:DMT family transporter [Bifidobacteriaceae bacterium]